MATATKHNLDARVTNPLNALRGTIRRYVVIEGLLAAVSQNPKHYCTACWTGRYPVPPIDNMSKLGMER